MAIILAHFKAEMKEHLLSLNSTDAMPSCDCHCNKISLIKAYNLGLIERGNEMLQFFSSLVKKFRYAIFRLSGERALAVLSIVRICAVCTV